MLIFKYAACFFVGVQNISAPKKAKQIYFWNDLNDAQEPRESKFSVKLWF